MFGCPAPDTVSRFKAVSPDRNTHFFTFFSPWSWRGDNPGEPGLARHAIWPKTIGSHRIWHFVFCQWRPYTQSLHAHCKSDTVLESLATLRSLGTINIFLCPIKALNSLTFFVHCPYATVCLLTIVWCLQLGITCIIYKHNCVHTSRLICKIVAKCSSYDHSCI